MTSASEGVSLRVASKNREVRMSVNGQNLRLR
jgi:hypothetical protein